MSNQRIVLVGSIKEFCEEVPLSPVRLNQTERQGGRGKEIFIPTVIVQIDLQGLNATDEIVWWHYSHELDLTPGGRKFWTPEHESIYDQYADLKDIIAAHLNKCGYEVRGGQYGIPEGIKPIRGACELAKWEKQENGTYQLIVI